MTRDRFPGRRSLAVVLLLVIGVVGGCGGSSASAPPTGATSTAAAVTPATDGTLFRDPAGVYAMRVASDWADGALQSPKIWYTGSESDGFSTNVNVIVEKLPSGIDLDRYIELSIENAPRLIDDFSLVTNERIDLPSGQPGVRLRFVGTGQGRPYVFVQIIAFDEGNAAAIATLTAVPELIDDEVDRAEPYMRTIAVVGSP